MSSSSKISTEVKKCYCEDQVEHRQGAKFIIILNSHQMNKYDDGTKLLIAFLSGKLPPQRMKNFATFGSEDFKQRYHQDEECEGCQILLAMSQRQFSVCQIAEFDMYERDFR